MRLWPRRRTAPVATFTIDDRTVVLLQSLEPLDQLAAERTTQDAADALGCQVVVLGPAVRLAAVGRRPDLLDVRLDVAADALRAFAEAGAQIEKQLQWTARG